MKMWQEPIKRKNRKLFYIRSCRTCDKRHKTKFKYARKCAKCIKQTKKETILKLSYKSIRSYDARMLYKLFSKKEIKDVRK